MSPYGWLPAAESGWRARLRFHCAWYRFTVLGARSDAELPCSGEYGNVLPALHAAAGKNFVSADAWSFYLQRRQEGWGVEPGRCTGNLLSSQALTLNLFGTLSGDLAWCTRTLAKVLGWTEGAATRVNVEYAPRRPSLFLGDKTRIDVLVEWQSGTRTKLIAVEVKLADRYVSRVLNIKTQPRYAALWQRSTRWNSVSDSPRLNQIFRLHALAEVISEQQFATRDAESPALLLLHHDLDPEAQAVMSEYQLHLVLEAQSSAQRATLSEFLCAMADTAHTVDHQQAVQVLRARYVTLDASEGAYQDHLLWKRASGNACFVDDAPGR
ncbi:PGN_0703 family putative restriction endonuclease [Rhodococcus erythropolis]|uniref:PGN_0703 family putative restriction endonuclease n=1 Tax=Rhodococcus erythropolis TaxID=1833 RepID=UPI0026C5DBEC